MSETTVVATNDDAEKLFDYLIAYRKHLSTQKTDSSNYEVTIGALQLEEDVTVSVEN
jgi:protein tyrosine/serine phosphatase